jgi:diacylglycerol kinase family enzyme
VGTFNYFARAHGISEDPAEATRTFLSGMATPVRIGLVGGRPFAVNASIGLHPKALEERERAQAKLGRSRLISIVSALVTLLRGHRQLPLEIDHDGVVLHRHSSTLVVANNPLQLEQVGVDEGVGSDPRRLTAITVAAWGIWSALGLFLRTVLGRLGEADSATTLSFERMTVSAARSSMGRRIKVAVDGEIHWHDMPLVFEVAPRRLQLLRSTGGPGEATP